MSEAMATSSPWGSAQSPRPVQFLTQVVPTWVHVGDAADFLQDGARIVGAIQREQWGGPMTVGQEANLGWEGYTELGRMAEQE